MLEGLGWVPGYEPALVASYLDLLQANPRDHLVAAAMGRMHLSLNEPQAARQYFEQAVWAHPTDGTAWLGIAAAALLRGGDERDAVNLVALAQLAVERDCGRFEWSVLDWNENAINFYKGMGADVMPDWRICRVAGDALTQLSTGTPKAA
ncbi:MAG: hypothetical protein RR376_09910 [Janthinobacterium sp.]